MISKKDIILEYSNYDEYALQKHGQLDNTVLDKLTENATHLYEELESKDFEEDMVIDSMSESQRREYYILESIIRHFNDEDPYFCDMLKDRQEDIKDSCYSEIPVEITDDDFGEDPGLNFDYESEEDDYDSQFD